jgi:hypothetical protein
MDATAERIEVVKDVIGRIPAPAMTPEQMAQRIAAAGNAARREDQAALAKAGEDKARVLAELRAIARSAWAKHDQKNRQLWFGLGRTSGRHPCMGDRAGSRRARDCAG